MILKEEIDSILSNTVLKEERGVAAHKYRDVVNEIVKYCQENVEPGSAIGAFFKNLLGKRNDVYTIKIPETITKKIDFIEELDITITFHEMGGPTVTESGGGRVSYSKKNGNYFTPEGKLCLVCINLDAFHHNRKVLTRTFTNSLYHELNHAYDVWSRRKDWKFIDKFNKDIHNGYEVRDYMAFSHNPTVTRFFKDLFYRLFIPTELNALVSGVYGDLRGMDSDLINYKRDIHNTQAAWVLDDFAEHFNDYLGLASVYVLMEACKKMNIDGISRQDPHTFLITFKQAFERKMREAWKGVGRAASMWYDDKEEAEMNKGRKLD